MLNCSYYLFKCCRQEGHVEAQELLRRLQMIVATNEAALVAARADR